MDQSELLTIQNDFQIFHMKMTGQNSLPQTCLYIEVVHSVMNIGVLLNCQYCGSKNHSVFSCYNIPTCPKCNTKHLMQNMCLKEKQSLSQGSPMTPPAKGNTNK